MKLKKLLAMVLCVAMVLSAMGTAVFAEETAIIVEQETGSDHDAVISSVTVNEIKENGLTYAVQFKGIEQVKDYTNWKMNVEMTVNKDITLEYDDNTAAGYLSVFLPEFQIPGLPIEWRNIPQNNLYGNKMDGIELKANESVKVLDYYMTDIFGINNTTPGYNDLFGTHKDMACGVYFTPEALAENDLCVTFDLNIYRLGYNSVVDETVTLASYTFGEKPEEVVGDTVKTEEQLVAALAAGGTVKLGADIEITTTEEDDVYTYIMTGENAVLDLNGYTISPAVDTRWDDEYYYILICGDLTITDTSVGGNGKIYGYAFAEYNDFHLSAECTYVDGKWTDAPTITVEGGNVENLALGNDVSVIVNGGNVSLCLYDSDYFYSEEGYSSYLSSLTFKGVSAGNFVNMPEGYELYIKSDGTYGIFEKAVEVDTLPELQAALAAEGNAPILITTQIVIPKDETVVLDLNGKNVIAAFNGSSTTNHIYALSNKGTLTVKDSVGTGSINSRGVYNYGTMTLESGKIAAIDGNGGYALNNEAGSTFVMNGGEVAATYEDDYKNSEGGFDATALDVPAGCTATLNGGKITDVCDFTYAVAAGGTLNIPASSTVEISGIHGAISVPGGTTTIDAGTFKVPYDNLARTDNVMYIYGGSCIINNGTFIGDGDNYSGGCCVYDSIGGVVINGGNFSKSSGGDVWGTTGTKINGGTFENLIETGHVTVGSTIINGGKKYVKKESGLVEAPEAVAKIGDVEYETLAEAIAAAQSGDTITLIEDITQEDGVKITDKVLTIDLADHTFKVTVGDSTNSRNMLINGASVVTVKNGTMIAGGETNSGTYGTVRTEGTANVTLENLELYNYRGNGLNIKSLGGTTVKISDTNIYSQYGGGIEAAGADITLDNVTVDQKGMWSAPYNSMAISVNGGGTVTVNSGTYTTEPLTAEDAGNQGTTHGSWAAGVLNSGGTLIINGGTFNNGNFGDDSLVTCARGVILADTGANIQINGGAFNGIGKIIDIQNNLGDASKNPKGTITGGTFSADPTNGYVIIADGLKVKEGTNRLWTIVSPVAKIGDTSYDTIDEAIAAAQSGDTVTLLDDVVLEKTLTIEKSITLDGDGHKLTPDANASLLSAIMAGNSGWGDEKNKDVSIKLANLDISGFNTSLGTVRVQGVEFEMDGCTLSNNTVTNDAYSPVSLNYANSLVKNSVFKNNTCPSVISVNYNADPSKTVVTVESCTFEGNNCSGAGVIYKNAGNVIIKNATFNGNAVSTIGNAAVVYTGWGSSDEVSGCLFKNNSVVTSHKSTKRFASAIFCDGCKVGGNAFENNTATRNGEAWPTTVAVGAYYGAADVSGNYFDGKTPVLGTDYTIEYTRHEVTCNSYYTAYSIDADGKVVLSDMIDARPSVAKVGDAEYKTLAEAIAAAQSGDTVTILNNIETSETFTIADGKDITIDLGGKTITATDEKASGNYELFYNYGKLTVKNGTINLTAENNREWSAASSIFHNRGGELVIESGSYAHLGGTSMAYVVDNSGNSFGDATTTINGGTITSSYIGIRNRMDTYNANGGGNGIATLIVNDGTISGKYAIWGQVSSAGVKGNIKIFGGTISGADGRDAVIVDADDKGAVVTEISGGTFSSDVSEFAADGFKVLDNGDGTYSVAADFSITVYVMPNEIYEEVWETLPTEITAGKFEITNIEWPDIIEESWAPVGDEDGIVVEADYFEYNDDEVTLPEGTVPVVKFVTIPDTFALKVDGLEKDYVVSNVGAKVVVKAAYAGTEEAGEVKFFYSIADAETGNVDVEMTELPENGVIEYFASCEAKALKTLTVYGTVGDKEMISKTVTVLKATGLFDGAVYNNATDSKPDYSALRINKNRDYTVSFAFTGRNGDYDFSNGKFVVEVIGTALVGEVTGIADGKGSYTFTPAEMVDIENGSYAAKVSYFEGEEQLYSKQRTVNIADKGFWYTDFVINGSSDAGQRVTKVAGIYAAVELDSTNADGNIYAGFKVLPYEDELVKDGSGTALVEGSNAYSATISMTEYAIGTYKLYALANMTDNQNFYDFAFGKTIYLANSYTNLGGIYANGISVLQPDIDGNGGNLTITPNWGGRKPAANQEVYWTFEIIDKATGEAIILDQSSVEGATVEEDGTLKVAVDPANVDAGFTVKAAKSVLPVRIAYVIKAYVNGSLDRAVAQRVLYIK